MKILRVAALLALVVEQVAVARSRAGKLGAALWARSLGSLPRLFALVPEQVAEG